MTEQSVLEKVRKLMALAEKAGTPEEAELAFSKAQAIMVKHAIDDAMLRASGHTVEREPIIVHKVHLGRRDEIKNSKMLLFMRVAEANQCRILDGTSHDEVIIIGHESSAHFVDMLVNSILMQYAAERTREWKAYQARYTAMGVKTPESRFKWVNGFSWGYAQRIGERIRETTRTESTKGKGGELVLRDKSAEVNDYVDGMVTGKGRPLRNRSSWESKGQGRSAANRADISGGRNNVRARSHRSLG